MNHGFFGVAAGTPEIRVGDCPYNKKSIIDIILRASESGVFALTLPELCITGYTCGDLFYQSALLDSAQSALISIIDNTPGMMVAVGLPLRHKGGLYDCAAVIYNKALIGVAVKSNPDGQFFPAPPSCDTIKIGKWEVPFGTGLLFKTDRDLTVGVEIGSVASCAQTDAVVILNPSAEPEIAGSGEKRRQLIRSRTAFCPCAYVCANAGYGESTTDFVFAGHNIIAEDNEILAESEPFAPPPSLIISEIDVEKLAYARRKNRAQSTRPRLTVPFNPGMSHTKLTRAVPRFPFMPATQGELNNILLIQAHGLKRRLEHARAKAVIGLSGGLDSTLTLLVALKTAELMGKDGSMIHAVTMPCFGTTTRTRSNAQRLCESLNIPLHNIDITRSVRQHLEDIDHALDEYDAAYENAQARERTQVLMDIANQVGGMVIGTGDLSELALGFCTYNGDHMSMYGVNASIPKTLARELVRHYAGSSDNEQLREVLYDIVNTPVSPELLPSDQGKMTQKTEGIVGPYELHDFFLYHFLRNGASPDKIQRLAEYAFDGLYDANTVSRWLRVFFRRFFSEQFKRSCMPDGPKATEISLSPRGGLIMPSDAAQWQTEQME